MQLATLASVVGQADATSGLEVSDYSSNFAHYGFCAVIALMTCISVYRVTMLYFHANGYGDGNANASWRQQFVGTAQTYVSWCMKFGGVFSTTPHVNIEPKRTHTFNKGMGYFPCTFVLLLASAFAGLL